MTNRYLMLPATRVRLSLGIVIKGPEGLVLAAESRITLQIQDQKTGQTITVHFDNAQKVLKFSGSHSHVAAVTYGLGGIGLRSAYSFMPEFESTLENKRPKVIDFAKKLSTFYQGQWKAWQEANKEPYKGPPMNFVVAGYNEAEPYGRVCQFDIPSAPDPREMQDVNAFGMTWGGQRETVDRLLAGYDGRVLGVAKDVLSLTDDQVKKLAEGLGPLQMPVPVQYLALQDCIDLALFFIRTTMEAQRLTVGIRGVGGPIDVATITRTEGFSWVQRKKPQGERTASLS
jgi:hypothetical protein